MQKVSIVVINYNDKLRVRRAIDSALHQTWSNTEVIVVDDGSDKDVRVIYDDYTFFDSGLKLIQLERDDKSARTPSRARNAGFKEATGDYICFLDSDNYFDKTFVEQMMKPGKDVTFCNWDIVGLQTYSVNIEKVWNLNEPVLNNYLQFTHLDHQCVLAKKELLTKLNDNGLPYDERLPRSQDCDFLVGLMLLTQNWELVPKHLFTFEKHEDDQMKQFASIHGKTLWTLKRNINIQWLSGIISKDAMLMLSFYQAVKDFTTKKIWIDDFKKSEFAQLYSQHQKILDGERKEK
jgi:glycosyltransferase involved in cell wall biosynthesis